MLDGPLFDHLIRPHQERLGNHQPEGLGGFQIDDELELGRLLNWEVAWIRAFQDLVDVDRGATVLSRKLGA